MKKQAAVFFDKNDYQLLAIVNDILERRDESQALRSLLIEYMHPQGIKELAAPRGLRIAYAIAGLLGTFEKGRAVDRIRALRSLRDEVFLAPISFYQKNTSRVLVQIMKELVRSRGNELQQLKLAHDFRMVSTGKPRLVRAKLAEYHLLEMPEEWNQYAFDDHVHDANTKGRKSPTHLVMDAWIKGIRYLTVVYYNYVSPEVVEELLEASAILDVRVQVGIEMSARFREKFTRITWELHGLNDTGACLKFLRDDMVTQLLTEGRQVSLYQQSYVFDVLDAFNDRHRHVINSDLQLALDPLQHNDFLKVVGAGQPSVLHLARFIHNELAVLIDRVIPLLVQEIASAESDRTKELQQRLERLQLIDVDYLIERYLLPSRNPEIRDPGHPEEDEDAPTLLRYSPKELLNRLHALHPGSKFTLNLSNLSIQDILELLYSCEGMITHVEAYNLKDAVHGMTSVLAAGRGYFEGDAVDLKSPERQYSLISDLQRALNEDNVIGLKRVIRAIIWDYEEQRLRLKKQIELAPDDKPAKGGLLAEHQQMATRKSELVDILYHLEKIHNFYKKRTLRSRIGSSSTGQAEHHHGMGLVVLETLPPRALRAVQEGISQRKRELIPTTARLTKITYFQCGEEPLSQASGRNRLLAKLSALKKTYRKWQDWSLDEVVVHPGTVGNIATLGGIGRNGEHKRLFNNTRGTEKLEHPWRYLNTNLKNWLKVLIGLVPAFLTFSLTKDWWVLAYLGAFIWFGITGLRNIIQSVLGGGGLRRSPLLPWNSFVSWSRISDSLLYTGFSVPLLDFLVKTLLLDRTLGITTATDPVLLYAVMGLANGIYISGHNVFRGLPRNAAVGNFFRSILAIPLAILLNSLLGTILMAAGVPDPSGELQKWAAIISKFASDCVAACIEGLADRQINIRARLASYRIKISQQFAVFSRLDLLFPEEDVLEILQTPKIMIETLNYEAREQETLIIVNALDLMYFWMYQPRARKALEIIFKGMSREEWLIFYRSQLVLKHYKEVSQMFVDGLVGRDFSKALAFYLDQYEEYLADLERIGLRRQWV